MRKVVLPIAALVLVSAFWEGTVQSGLVNKLVLPAPSAIVACLIQDKHELFSALGTTAFAAGCGFLLSAVLGLGLAVLLAGFPILMDSLYPYAVFFQTVPVIAVA